MRVYSLAAGVVFVVEPLRENTPVPVQQRLIFLQL